MKDLKVRSRTPRKPGDHLDETLPVYTKLLGGEGVGSRPQRVHGGPQVDVLQLRAALQIQQGEHGGDLALSNHPKAFC